ncbi:carbohydrate ABC transporter membrane protein 2 (CUT1 family) [Arthrobacter sp. SLBN-112]|jgi:raffinose/stachyose/melibiose transport system permease protein|uniref:carbohydrate ABC transporter permease n=1 Tax=Arthrobacter sp. SLBN-112 TaxID=2768452 RepID=UPI001150CCB6|nr:carbohydrate ABC transporter permease [Arthrobacter sp. SLBN-112]TQJ39950.1 carbohydrate ABC transporter membrane protein 2 (CUT1 family) [Arthrobacter sp. SLBN-112]
MLASLSRRAILAIYAVIIIVPLTVVAFGSFKTTQELFAGPFSLPHSLSTDNFTEVVGGQNLGSSFMNSVIVTGISVPLTLFLASLAGYAVSRLKGFMSWAIFGFLVLGMAIPAQANMVPLYVLFGRLGLLDNLGGLILANVVSTLPIAVFILGGFMRTLPKELYEASSIDGSGPWKTYSSIALPLSAPSIAAAAIFLFVIHWNELLYPLLFIQTPGNRTLPLALLSFQGEFQTNYPLLFAGVILASLPVVVAYVFLQRYFVAGITAGASKG